ncbi:hypothetical protein SAY86_005360 [Trapa natans]|uniref:HECT-type E3 ubiquitin transferase n=1 Tax=Trapa natans TaxID=22666 RepID=A0AAN7QSE7_TRANT|nr:hypothetical protein SAY86_005360 [Trapa natans]
METRGQKRTDVADELPADKRACNSLESWQGSSNSTPQTQVNSTNSPPHSHETDMETSSTASPSIRSEGEPDRESAYGFYDSEDLYPQYSGLLDFRREHSFEDNSNFNRILSNLVNEEDPSAQVSTLMELCELLSFCTEDSLSSIILDLLSPILVNLAKDSDNPDIMLLAIRAITYLCDVFPPSSGILVQHDAIHALCDKLMAIDYLDCLQALDKISRDQPLACLQAGTIGAVLNLIDFLSTSMQRVALSVVVNICHKLPSENPSLFMGAVPILCNLLQYEDGQLIESVVTCFVKIVDSVSLSQERLDEICKHGLINHAVHLIGLNGRATMSQATYNDMIGMLAELSCGSANAFRTLHELNISSILKFVLSTGDISHGTSSHHLANRQNIQVLEILKLLYELLPTSSKCEDTREGSEKQAFLADNPVFIQRLGMGILPLLIQMVNSGVNLYVCYCCLSVINNFFVICTTDILDEVLTSTNFSSFLAGVFSRKEQHILIMALKIAETCLQKLSDVFLNSFMKEGVFFAIDALLKPEESACKMFPAYGRSELLLHSRQRIQSKGDPGCFCYALKTVKPKQNSKSVACKHEKDAVFKLATDIRAHFFTTGICGCEGATEVLRKLRRLSASINELSSSLLCAQHEGDCHFILNEIMKEFSGQEPISTFEFIESGILKSIVGYLSYGLSMHDKVDKLQMEFIDFSIIEKRVEVFARLILSSSEAFSEELPLVRLTRRLQTALSSLENFPVILNSSKQQRSYAMFSHSKYLSHPCFKLRFLKDEDEMDLFDYSQNVLTVDPFTSLESIERYLYHKVTREGKKSKKSPVKREDLIPTCLPMDTSSSQEESPETDGAHLALTKVSRCKDDVGTANSPSSSNKRSVCPKLVLSLEGQELDLSYTLYQAVLQQQMKMENEIVGSSKLWSEVHTVTYRSARDNLSSFPSCSLSSQAKIESAHNLVKIFTDGLATDVERSGVVYDILILLKLMNLLNKLSFELLSRERISTFSEGKFDDLNTLKVAMPYVLQSEFVSYKLTEKLEQHMCDLLVSSTGALALWCIQLMGSCPFLFSFESRCKYFQLAAFGRSLAQSCVHSYSSSDGSVDRIRGGGGVLVRKKLLVYRDRIMASVAEVMDVCASNKEAIEVQFDDEVGTGLGPTLEFFTLVSHEFQRIGHSLWRGDHGLSSSDSSLNTLNPEMLTSPHGIFPRPWSLDFDESGDEKFVEVINKFFILGKVVAKALQDGRVLDFHFSRAFYKMIIGQELNLYDIHSFDPDLGRTLLEFQALSDKKRHMESLHGEKTTAREDCSRFRNTNIEDLCIDFSVPGYPDYTLSSYANQSMVNMMNLDDYVSLVVDATVKTGISRQVEAFKSGFDEVFPIRHLQIFSEEELECLLCGEHDAWAITDLLDHIKFDHGYTASSPPILNLLDIIQEFDLDQRRAFLQFVTGAPRLPPGGLMSLNPKLTIVRKHCSKDADDELPSVMTCANYLKLPPYSSKEKMRDKVLYAIREGQGSFHLS